MEAIAVASTVGISAPGQQMFVMSYKPSVSIVRSNTHHTIWASGTSQSEVTRLRDKDSMLVEYLRGKGYGSLSLAEVEERQSQLGIFRSSNPFSLLQDSGTMSSRDFQANTEYLKEKGFGSLSLEEVMELQQHLGIFGRPYGGEGMLRRDYGVEDISEDKGESELHGI